MRNKLFFLLIRKLKYGEVVSWCFTKRFTGNGQSETNCISSERRHLLPVNNFQCLFIYHCWNCVQTARKRQTPYIAPWQIKSGTPFYNPMTSSFRQNDVTTNNYNKVSASYDDSRPTQFTGDSSRYQHNMIPGYTGTDSIIIIIVTIAKMLEGWALSCRTVQNGGTSDRKWTVASGNEQTAWNVDQLPRVCRMQSSVLKALYCTPYCSHWI